MNYLLDTVAVVRWWTEPSKLSSRVHQLIETSDEAMFLSPVSVWEIANKVRIGKMPQIVDFDISYPQLLRDNAFTVLPLTDRHAMRAGYLPGDHRDPFDRLLAGQALVEDLTVLTNDAEIARFGCRTLW